MRFSRSPAPGLEMIDPALHLKSIAAQLGYAERSRPAVVHQRVHGNFDPLLRALAMRQQRRGNRVVAVGENIGLDAHLVAHGALGGKRPPSTAGDTASITTRLRPSVCFAFIAFPFPSLRPHRALRNRFRPARHPSLFNQPAVKLNRLMRNRGPAEDLFHAPSSRIAKAPAFFRIAQASG